jgi:hypothetical protein
MGGLVDVSYSKVHKKRVLQDTLPLDSMHMTIPLKHCFLLCNLKSNQIFQIAIRKEQLITAFSELLNSYLPSHGFTTE